VPTNSNLARSQWWARFRFAHPTILRMAGSRLQVPAASAFAHHRASPHIFVISGNDCDSCEAGHTSSPESRLSRRRSDAVRFFQALRLNLQAGSTDKPIVGGNGEFP